jgi:CBS-domain-containing membrane protein
MEWFSRASHYPLVIDPFASSIVLVIGSPEAGPAQPRALIGGHVVSTMAGVAMLQSTGPHA